MESFGLQTYLKIIKNDSHVFISEKIISEQQMSQIVSDTNVVIHTTNLWPNLMTKLLPPKSVNNCDCNQTKSLFIVNKSSVNTRNGRKRKSFKLSKIVSSTKKKPKLNRLEIDNQLKTTKDGSKGSPKDDSKCARLSRLIGLPNLGNTCYINSIIQVLRMTPDFRQFVCSLIKNIDSKKNGFQLKISNKNLINCLHNIFVHFGQNEENFEKTSLKANENKITALIECEDIKKRFELGQQHDCHEFLNWLINELNSFAELLSNNSKKSTKRVRRNSFDRRNSCTFEGFQGVMSRSTQCSECQYKSSVDDSFADIQIPLCLNEEVTDNTHSQTFTEIMHKKDCLEDDNKFDCNQCSKKTTAFRFNQIKIPPKILIIFITKPYEYIETITRKSKEPKKLFKVPLHLEYSSDVSSSSINYSLYGFIMHSGADINNGHYYAVIDSNPKTTKRNSRQKSDDCRCAKDVLSKTGWIKINDHKVTELTTTSVNNILDDNSISSTPYLAFYRRTD